MQNLHCKCTKNSSKVFNNKNWECIDHSLDSIKLTRDTFLTFNFDGDYFWGSRSIRMLDLLLIRFRWNSGTEVDRIIELKKFWYCWNCAGRSLLNIDFEIVSVWKTHSFKIHHDRKWPQRRFVPFWQIDWMNLSFSNTISVFEQYHTV